MLTVEEHSNINVVIQDNNKNIAIQLSLLEWEKLIDVLPIIMSVWNSHVSSPYVPHPMIPLIICSYNWYVVDELDMVFQKSKELFLTPEHALSHYNNEQITSSPFLNQCSVKTSRKMFQLDLKELIKFLFIYIYQLKIFKLKNKKCTSCTDGLLAQQSHYDGCLLDSWDATATYFNQVQIDRDEVCKIVWEIKKKLRLECAQLEVENLVDCHMYYVQPDQLKHSLKFSIPLMYKYLFTEVIQ